MSAFDRPPGSPEALAGVVATLQGLARNLSSCSSSLHDTTYAVHAAWEGTRGDDFYTAAVGVRAQVVDAVSNVAALATAVGDLQRHLHRVIADVADYEAKADAAAQNAHDDTAHLDRDDPRVNDAKKAAGRTREHYENLALDAKHDYQVRAHAIAVRIDAITDQAVPGGHALSPDQLRSAVDSSTGVTGLDGTTALTGSTSWGVLEEWTEAVPTAELDDGGLDATQLVPWQISTLSPTAANAWWTSLPTAQQVALARTRPDVIGNLDGLPAWARDLANRTELSARTEQLRTELDRDRPVMPYDGKGMARYIAALDHRKDLQTKLDALNAVAKVLAQKDPRQLLVLDVDSGVHPHAAVAVGDVDTADNVDVFTPGLTTTVEKKMGQYDRDMALLKSKADELDFRFNTSGTPSTTATVAWLGYDAPQVNGDLLKLFSSSVASSHLAKQGGTALASFYRGINASRDVDPHLVALGHSYGSSTTGYALQHSGLGVDDAVVFGSPGLGTGDATELHVPKGHIYAIEADGDPVADIPRFGGVNPDHLPGVTLLSADADTSTGTLASHGHTAYLDDKSTSQYDMALVTLGLGDKAPHADRQPANPMIVEPVT